MPGWNDLPAEEIRSISNPVREEEWFAFGGEIYRRERTTLDRQKLFLAGAGSSGQEFLRAANVGAAAERLAPGCGSPAAVASDDDYPIASATPGAPVFRLTCGQEWFDIDGASGALLERLGPSQREYRWLFEGLHRLDFPALVTRPKLRTILIILLCGCGLVFSMTGVILASRRVASFLRATETD
jgi:hypothetical protein